MDCCPDLCKRKKKKSDGKVISNSSFLNEINKILKYVFRDKPLTVFEIRFR